MAAIRRWRDYRTPAGGRPIKDFLQKVSDEDAAEIVAAMKEVGSHGLSFARHLRGDIYEVRTTGDRAFRILFAVEGKRGQVLLSLVAFDKKTAKTPPRQIELAIERLNDWRRRGVSNRRRAKK